ncbi:protein EPIDERMAL PATTERNING FACTOR 1-like [Carica papaya]|uniref:protein EPIDERMAL PATTERNING FACTOR 1-like n=1 Tax=Carica papaya TaxID=3649 RepID=UPI000B8CBC1F|nr:protein EPIDERMAL PATTERNING FACTOR 1-like [Carica papaya]
MKGFVCIAAILTVLLLVPAISSARHISRPRTHHRHHHSHGQGRTREGTVATAEPNYYYRERRIPPTKRKGPDTLQIAGSSLPDCSHACGSCSPCRLVMVSFVCASLEEAETCPMAYKCMCNNKSYPVP